MPCSDVRLPIKKNTRKANREKGVSTQGHLTAADKWRRLELGDSSKVCVEKLSFLPILRVGNFGPENLARLQRVQASLVEAVRRKGGGVATTKTEKHQPGISLGRTVVNGGKRPAAHPQEEAVKYSGTIQLKTLPKQFGPLQQEVTDVITACIEEAFGDHHWYRACKQSFEKVPENRRLPNSSVPGSNIWWSWNHHKPAAHIDQNAVGPCFVLCPHTYCGGELLVGANNLKVPLPAVFPSIFLESWS